MSTGIYDETYIKRFIDRANTELGRRIYRSRWKLIEKYCHGNLVLLDFGCGPGVFHRSGTNGFCCYGYDVNPFSGFSGMNHLPAEIDVLTMWDSIEHVPSPVYVIREWKPEYIFLSTPNTDSVNGSIKDWKHYRPKEHLYYFNLKSLEGLLGGEGYEILEHNFEEGALRDPDCPKAIITIAARKSV